ncbi:MAG TPA: AAA family ATPase, partial [Candidatus Woesebacteria bacterium]|nr:AAA family ATPase [Candidatus Woesebacteria bacterium]
MAKSKSSFICQACGASHPKWQGRCNGCGAWNSLVEEIETPIHSNLKTGQKLNKEQLASLVVTRPETNLLKSSKQRFSSLIGELDRVLGGGIVPGAVMLLGGEPGIGKSTLLTQVSLLLAGEPQSTLLSLSTSTRSSARKINQPQESQRVLYVCGEESPDQINIRINRIINNDQFLSTIHQPADTQQINRQIDQNLQFVTTSDVDQLVQIIEQYRPRLVVVDSIQTLSTQDLSGASGSIGQLRECAERLIGICKSQAVACFLVGHVTKDGVIAGPKVLEHMVDSVLQLEGERTGQFRLLRA